MESTTEPLLVRADEAARLCGASARTWRTWDAGGLVPRGVQVGRARFWRTADLAPDEPLFPVSGRVSGGTTEQLEQANGA